MIRYLCLMASLLFSTWLCADTGDWRIVEASAPVSGTDRQRIGEIACSDEEFEVTDEGVHCMRCPEYTGDPGANSGLDIDHALTGHFTDASAGVEWILDTSGCEAHFANFGGVILLQPEKPAKTFSLLSALGRQKRVEGSGRLKMSYYRPGFRLNDCLVIGHPNERNLLVCNEVEMAQGEVIGHISTLDIGKRGINRWRLLRWYDNSAGNSTRILSVVPTRMHTILLENGEEMLHVSMRIAEIDSTAAEPQKLPESLLNLDFRRKGQRLFATASTQRTLEEINLLTTKMLD
ncbi:MAG: hypothetical protein H6965_10625 [Chromatiaceae bacterium]|nr:hypothetical protein [Chromatiaceae bacterium]